SADFDPFSPSLLDALPIWLIWIRVSNYFFLRVRVGSLHSRQIVGRRQVSHHRIQKGLYPFIFKCRSTKYRREIHVDNRLTNSSHHFLLVDGILILEELLHQLFVISSYLVIHRISVYRYSLL